MDKGRVKECIDKTREFYKTNKLGCALLKVKTIATQMLPAISLTDYAFPQDMYQYLDARAQRYMMYLNQRADLDDDTIPAEGPWYGIAEHTAFLGGSVDYRPETSWHHALLNSPDELDKLTMDKKNPIFQMVVGGISYMREKYGNDFLPMVRGASGALEMANTLRGNDFFYDFYEEPDSLKKLLEYCSKALIWNYEHQLEAAGVCFGGIITGFGEWLPGRGLGHVSEDTTTMNSLEQFEEFGHPFTKHVYQHFDEVFLHMHALSEHCLASAASLPNLLLMEISSDPNTDRAVEVWRRNRQNMPNIIPVLRLTRKEIETNMDLLKTQKTIVWYDASSLEDAKDMCRLFSKELPVI